MNVHAWPRNTIKCCTQSASDSTVVHKYFCVVLDIMQNLHNTQKTRNSELYVLLLFFIYLKKFNHSRQTNHLKVYKIDLCHIFRVDRTQAVDDQSEISYSIPQRTLPW